jgi:hypothetical protein
MTLQDLINYCTRNNIDFDTNIAVRAKDDYLLMAHNVSLDTPYFGNCMDGEALLRSIIPRDENDDEDYENTPMFLILDTGRG